MKITKLFTIPIYYFFMYVNVLNLLRIVIIYITERAEGRRLEPNNTVLKYFCVPAVIQGNWESGDALGWQRGQGRQSARDGRGVTTVTY